MSSPSWPNRTMDIKPFITQYTSDESDRLQLRAHNGIRSNKYQPVDYDKLKLMAAEKKFAAQKSLLKVKKIEQMSKQSKENLLLKQHKLIWQKEFMRLNYLRKRIQAEVESHRRQNATEGSGCCRMYEHFDLYESSLDEEFAKFKLNTCEPIWNLREDLQFWIQDNHEGIRLGDPDVVDKHAEIRQTINQVKGQQNSILQQLYNEQKCLEGELQSGFLWDITHGTSETPHIDFAEGIPAEAFDLECSDDELKITVLQEFIIIDEKFRERLYFLEDEHSKILRGLHGGWSEEDHFCFLVNYDQYPRDLNNRRKLILDRLRRHLPHKARHELVAHEEWCEANKYFHERKRALVVAWRKGRSELMNKARSTFIEVEIAKELAEVKAEYSREQKKIREELYQKVRKWREQKLEAMMLQQKIDERNREEALEQHRLEEEREKKRRTHEKEQIQKFIDEKAEKRRQQAIRDQERMEELRRLMEEQMVVDKERVEYRKEQLDMKIEERKVKEEKKAEEEIEKERRLEALREQVRVIAEFDPVRMMQDTKAWQAKNSNNEEDEEINIQKPLFEINTFNSKQITTDPRMRLEAKLREAGLHTSPYARQVLAAAPPPQPPRRDMESTVFKYD
ncbi:coiled-coil domain-containing protein 148-like isoform X2 [Ostrea edulis]|uniref:coiled-coil domain-containing protein 148-like isoform X2 n=1 Tax=Ostrea edulis TaxID=37623 RepID=UPI0024AEAE26|nr:coiled-coil domain-containing protein 148-like isoform X2 [Ostrea edulis]